MMCIKAKIKLFVITLLSIFLVGCLGITPNMQQYSEKTGLDNKAVVIAELKNATTLKVVKFDQNFNNKNRKEYKIKGMTKLWSIPIGSYKQVVFVTEPGIYFISKADYKVGNTTYYTILDGLTPEGKVIYGAFEVKPGEVVYLGDLKFDWNKKAKCFVDVVRNYDKVYKDLNASDKYKHLASELKFAKFYKAGSTISINGSNIIIQD